MIQKIKENKESIRKEKINLSVDDYKEIDKSMLCVGINIIIVQAIITIAYIIFYGMNWYSINGLEITKPIRSWCIGLYILTSISIIEIFSISYIIAIKRYKKLKYKKVED